MEDRQRIAKKAHFGDRTLQKVTIPQEISFVEDWAYASCVSLREVRIPCDCRISEKAFAGSDGIGRICLSREEQTVNAYPELLALTVRIWQQQSPTAIEKAQNDKEFLSWIDGRLNSYLTEADDTGFRPFLAGGEEDYGEESEERASYIRKVQKDKVRLILERLSADPVPDGPGREDLLSYINAHSPGYYFELVRETAGRRLFYEELFMKYPLYDTISTEQLLQDAGDDIELRALILRGREPGKEGERLLWQLEI